MHPEDQVRSVYDTVAASYAAVLPDVSDEAPLDLAMVEELARHVGASEHRRVLDAGCGAGRMVGFLDTLGAFDIDGVDLSPGMIEQARRTYRGRRFVVGALADLPYPDAQFDGVLAWYSIIHTPADGLGAVMAELRRVCRPGGVVLLLGFQAGDDRERVLTSAYGHDVTLTAQLHAPATVRAALQDAGMRVTAELGRAPRDREKHPQAFVLAQRPH